MKSHQLERVIFFLRKVYPGQMDIDELFGLIEILTLEIQRLDKKNAKK